MRSVYFLPDEHIDYSTLSMPQTFLFAELADHRRLIKKFPEDWNSVIGLICSIKMIKFEKLEDDITVGNKYKVVSGIDNKEDADSYLSVLVEHCIRLAAKTGESLSEEAAINIEKDNIGYYAGYFDTVSQQRIFELFDTEHPLFGRITPTNEQAFKAGGMMAEGMKAGKTVEHIIPEIRLALGVDSAHEYIARKKLLKDSGS